MIELPTDGELEHIDQVVTKTTREINCVFCRSQIFMTDETAAEKYMEKEAKKLREKSYKIEEIRKHSSEIGGRKCFWHHIFVSKEK